MSFVTCSILGDLLPCLSVLSVISNFRFGGFGGRTDDGCDVVEECRSWSAGSALSMSWFVQGVFICQGLFGFPQPVTCCLQLSFQDVEYTTAILANNYALN